MATPGGNSAPPSLTWNFIQSFGDDNSSDDDLVTSVDFDSSGRYLAVGDKAGRICIFEGRATGSKCNHPLDFKFYTEFQSHAPEFDCLKSLEIEEKINMIKWCKKQNNGLFILATNVKTIKLWKVHEKKIKRPATRIVHKSSNNSNINIPTMSHYQTVTTSTPKRVFSNAHGYYINSISLNSDDETFISADDLRIHLWNTEVSDQCFNIVDIKPPNLEELTEVITSACFHPTACNILLYSNSRGSIRLGDLRHSALCDQHAKLFEVEEDPANKSFFSEIISSIADSKFTADGRYIISRDYLTLKMWDVNMESKPVLSIPIHDYLKMYLCDLYEKDCIFDKFECAVSKDGTQLLTGSYNNFFVMHDTTKQQSVTIEALKNPPPVINGIPQEPPDVNLMDFSKRALHVDWHPTGNVVAVAGLNKLYIYEATKEGSVGL